MRRRFCNTSGSTVPRLAHLLDRLVRHEVDSIAGANRQRNDQPWKIPCPMLPGHTKSAAQTTHIESVDPKSMEVRELGRSGMRPMVRERALARAAGASKRCARCDLV